MKSLKYLFVVCILLSFHQTFSKNLYTSKQKGKTTKDQFLKAYTKAKEGDVIILDIDVYFNKNDKPIVITKNNITIKGAIKNKQLPKLERRTQNNFILKVTANNINFENIVFVNGMQQLYFDSKEKVNQNIKINNCRFKNGKYTGLNFRGKYKNITISNCTFNNTKFSLQTMDCAILENFTIDSCKFIGGDHQISLDNPLSKIIKHENIVIKNSVFELCERFNLALANTKNVVITNNTFKGGIQKYSQALHFEDRTENVNIYNNKITCMADVAILLYATDKIGHGKGRRLTEQEKIDSGCGNITLNHNIITSGNADSAISIGYGKGFIKILKNNTIISNNKGINTFKSLKTTNITIDKNVIIKNKTYQQIALIKDVKLREQYIKIR